MATAILLTFVAAAAAVPHRSYGGPLFPDDFSTSYSVTNHQYNFSVSGTWKNDELGDRMYMDTHGNASLQPGIQIKDYAAGEAFFVNTSGATATPSAESCCHATLAGSLPVWACENATLAQAGASCGGQACNRWRVQYPARRICVDFYEIIAANTIPYRIVYLGACTGSEGGVSVQTNDFSNASVGRPPARSFKPQVDCSQQCGGSGTGTVMPGQDSVLADMMLPASAPPAAAAATGKAPFVQLNGAVADIIYAQHVQGN